MPSNVENILNAILTGDGSGIQKPASRVEELLFEIYEQGGGGGGESVIGGIKLTIDENYVMTATLVDKDGEEYGVSDDIDLPLEEMVVDAEYDPQTQKINLELKNGNYVEFSVAELVSGLQTELSSSNKLNPAYIAYDASHRAVSDAEISTWNAKQNAISDLDTIRSGAAAGATAVQPSEMQTALSAKQDVISDLAAIRSGASAGASAVQPETMSTALALKQDSLDNAQLAAVNSGIDSNKVGQIETNKTNILLVGKQIDAITNALSASDFTWTLGKVISSYGVIVDDAPYGAITDAINIDSATAITAPTFNYQDNPVKCNVVQYNANNEMVGVRADASGDVVELLDTATYFRISFQFISTSGITVTQEIINSVFKCDLLYSTENTAKALVDVVDKGAKNLIDLTAIKEINTEGTWNGNVFTHNNGGIFTVNQDATITVNTTQSIGNCYFWIAKNVSMNSTKTYILSGCPSGGSASTYFIKLNNSYKVDSGNGVGFTGISTDDAVIGVLAGTQVSVIFKPMICTEADWKISQEFQQYAAPNYDLTQLEQQDRNALVEVVDEGAKNILDLSKAETIRVSANVTYSTNSDGTITVTATNANAGEELYFINVQIPNGTYIASGCPAGGGDDTVQVQIYSGDTLLTTDYGNGSGQFSVNNGLIGYRIRFGVGTRTVTIKPMLTTKAKLDVSPNYAPFALPNTDLTRMMTPFFTVPINHNMIYRGQNLGDTLTDAQHTALSSGNFTDLYLGDYWTKTVTIPAFYEVTTAEPSDWSTNYTSYYTKSGDTYTPVSGDTAPTWAANTYYERLVTAQTVTLKAVIADFDTFYAGYASGYAGINTHHAAVIVLGFNNVVWNKTNTTAGGYANSLIHKWLVGSVLPQIETWFGSAKVLSHQKLLTNAITGDAASGWAWSSQKISLLTENQIFGSKVWGNSKATNGGYEPGEAFKHLNVFNHIDANLLFGDKNIWLRDIASAVGAADLRASGSAGDADASFMWVAPDALILLS